MTDLPAVSVNANRSDLQISWEAVTYYRDQHPEDYPVILVANITGEAMRKSCCCVMLATGK